ncbi:MAG: hypothetical protein IJX96_00615 [Clostridia bacterium]|nr:hypothetical protein [Clostridia bacterium]
MSGKNNRNGNEGRGILGTVVVIVLCLAILTVGVIYHEPIGRWFNSLCV